MKFKFMPPKFTPTLKKSLLEFYASKYQEPESILKDLVELAQEIFERKDFAFEDALDSHDSPFTRSEQLEKFINMTKIYFNKNNLVKKEED